MAAELDPLSNHVLSLLDSGEGREAIETELLEKGHDEKFVKEMVREVIKLRNARRSAQGLVYILGGAVICFTSFLLTITDTFTSGSFPYVLYGLTTVGIAVAFVGFMKIF